jgi:MOSC domain-containing protein YiiM
VTPPADTRPGRVAAIYIAPEHGGRPVSRERVTALPAQGLDGDRHFRALGDTGRDLTLIEAEAIEGLRVDTGIELDPGESRRNVVTREIALNDLVGKRFRVGPLECRGQALCEPCRHLERLTQPGVLRGLVHRGGLVAEILSGGEIAVGDPVAALSD